MRKDRPARAVLEVLRRDAGPRDRVVDEHSFRIDTPGQEPGMLRLQLFVAAGLRPVAIATQTAFGDTGRSLANAAEDYATAVWLQFFGQDDRPPIWIERTIFDTDTDTECGAFELVTFDIIDGHVLRRPDWHPITRAQLRELVGVEVDDGRGAHHVPPPEEVYLPVYSTVLVGDLPEPTPFRTECMVEGSPSRTDALRAMVRHVLRRPCCWYHTGDWHTVSETAIRLVHQAEVEGIAPVQIARHVLDAAIAEGLGNWEQEALRSLVSPGWGIQLARAADGTTSFTNGQHRSRALMDAGVHRVLVVDIELVESPST